MSAVFHYHSDQVNAARALVEKYHYSGRMTQPWFVASAHLEGGLFGDFGPAIAAAVWSSPPARWSEEVIELTRLVAHPEYDPPLTQLISWSTKQMRQRADAPDLLVSFADKSEGHHGGIYQACSWNYHGLRAPRMEGVIVDGVFIPGRTANARWGTQSTTKLQEMGIEATPKYDEGKHLYWKPLSRSGQHKANDLGLGDNEYPKPDQSPGSIASDAPADQAGEAGATPSSGLSQEEAA